MASADAAEKGRVVIPQRCYVPMFMMSLMLSGPANFVLYRLLFAEVSGRAGERVTRTETSVSAPSPLPPPARRPPPYHGQCLHA